MYLRYGDPSWDADQAADSAAASASAPEDNGARRPGKSGNGRLEGAHAPNAPRFPTVELHGVDLHAITEAACIRHILDEIHVQRGGMVVTPNLDHLRRCTHDVNFSALVAEADLVVADGMPLVWASRLQGTPLPERVAGSNLISSLSVAAGERGRSIYLLGGSPGTAEAAARVLRERHPCVKVAGTYYPPIGFEDNPTHMSEMVQGLTSAAPDIVYVALGSPKQERLIARLRPILPAAWWLGVGNSFSFLCGDVRRAPRWMQKCGLEWVHRLCQEPRRLFRRYVVVGIPFATSLLGKSALRGIPNRLMPSKRNRIARRSQKLTGDASGNGHAPTAPARTPAPAVQRSAPAIAANWTTPAITESTAQSSSVASIPDNKVLARLRALVLLGGSVRPSALCTSADRSALDLPLDENGSVLNHWLSQAAEVARAAGTAMLAVRVMVDQISPEPASADAKYYGTFRVERDSSDYRGTGGVLHDVAREYDDDDWILVANAAQVLVDPLATLVSSLVQKGGDVSVISHADGTPSGVMLINCKTLRVIAADGYIDMKEQALPLIAQQFDVRVVRRRRPTGLPIRSLEDYIQGLRYHHRRRIGKPSATDPLAEDWTPSFALVEPGALVDPSARLHDSVVLRGGIVEPGAVLVRSVVCSGGIVRRDKSAVDQFITGAPDTVAVSARSKTAMFRPGEAVKGSVA